MVLAESPYAVSFKYFPAQFPSPVVDETVFVSVILTEEILNAPPFETLENALEGAMVTVESQAVAC